MDDWFLDDQDRRITPAVRALCAEIGHDFNYRPGEHLGFEWRSCKRCISLWRRKIEGVDHAETTP